ncbi:thioredoxin-like protein [Pleurotus eryngii]|uniref:Thioredoxin-like protein n=1 Tax=Pleurotus eryngii TaxID=5323 RepID=A0A9P5ZZC0_PLEER|nr:thioredoxin-like protein [Pleurotus eryngii]
MEQNPKALSLAARLVAPNTRSTSKRHEEEEDDDDAIFDELQAEIENDSNPAIRQQGLALLKLELERKKEMQQSRHGEYTEITDEKEVIRASAKEQRCVIHFYHSNFKRCQIMDKHLAKLAPKYYGTRFMRVFVENVPWLVEKLAIKVLPCVICFMDGVTKDRLVGFEELGNNDSFDTAQLEWRLSRAGVIQKAPTNQIDQLYKVSSASRSKQDNEDVFDIDD